MNFLYKTLLTFVFFYITVGETSAQKSIVLSSTTSTEQSGLFGHILPPFEKKTGIQVKVVAVGTGQALDIGRRGDADVVFVHDKVAEAAANSVPTDWPIISASRIRIVLGGMI